LLVALSPFDRDLLDRCLARQPGSWEAFVDRFLGLVVHVISHTAEARSIRLVSQDFDDLAGDVFLTIVSDDFGLLRRFRGESSLATYLTVIARRVVVRDLQKRKTSASFSELLDSVTQPLDPAPLPEERIKNRDEVERMLERLEGPEADVVRMYHLEGKTYREISEVVGIPENSVGPTLSRARAKLRRASADVAPRA